MVSFPKTQENNLKADGLPEDPTKKTDPSFQDGLNSFLKGKPTCIKGASYHNS